MVLFHIGAMPSHSSHDDYPAYYSAASAVVLQFERLRPSMILFTLLFHQNTVKYPEASAGIDHA